MLPDQFCPNWGSTTKRPHVAADEMASLENAASKRARAKIFTNRSLVVPATDESAENAGFHTTNKPIGRILEYVSSGVGPCSNELHIDEKLRQV